MSKGKEAACTVERADLVRALGTVAGVIEARNTIPILSNVLVSVRDGWMTLTGTNLDQWMRVKVPARGELAPITLVAARLRAVAGGFDDGSEISFTPDDGKMVVRSGRSRFELPTLPEDDFPVMKDGDVRSAFTIKGDDLAAAFARCAWTMSTEETRYYLNGLFFHRPHGTADGVVRIAATDGTSLSAMGLKVEGADDWPDLIMMAKVVRLLERDLKGVEEDVEVEALAPTGIRVRWAGHDLTSKEIDGSFPDYTRVIPPPCGNVLTVDPAKLAIAVKRVAAVGDDKTRAVRLAMREAWVRLSCVNPLGGIGEDEVDAQWGAAEMDAGFNSRFLTSALDAVGGSLITISIADPKAATLFKAVGGDDFQVVVMPLRV